jgi:antitoxin component YwqK of YwqJK toxin-antitoxin module
MKYVLIALSFVCGMILAFPVINHYVSKTGHRAEGKWVNFRKDGIWTYWYDANQKEAEGKYKNDLQTGVWSYWHPNGQKSAEGIYDDAGKRNGTWTEWYDNGQKSIEGNFENDKEVGVWTRWHKNGFKKSQGEYFKGYQHGTWIYYTDIDGKEFDRKNYPTRHNIDE